MEQTSKINDIKLLEDSLINRPCEKHDEDHIALRSSMRILLVIVKKLEALIGWNDVIRSEEWESLADMNKRIIDNNNNIKILSNNIKNLWQIISYMWETYPKISTMQKQALITNGENVIDTVELESWRYLMVKNITPSDWNEFAKLDRTFSWEVIEVTDWKYDVKVDLWTNTQWETATMTVNIDLLFVKY